MRRAESRLPMPPTFHNRSSRESVDWLHDKRSARRVINPLGLVNALDRSAKYRLYFGVLSCTDRKKLSFLESVFYEHTKKSISMLQVPHVFTIRLMPFFFHGFWSFSSCSPKRFDTSCITENYKRSGPRMSTIVNVHPADLDMMCQHTRYISSSFLWRMDEVGNGQIKIVV